MLALEDLKDKTPDQIRDHISQSYETDRAALNRFEILIAYESVGSWGCDSSSWFLVRELAFPHQLFENHASHCSCYGFENQWSPEPTTVEYLKSEKFSFCCGGYDDNESTNKQSVKDWINTNL